MPYTEGKVIDQVVPMVLSRRWRDGRVGSCHIYDKPINKMIFFLCLAKNDDLLIFLHCVFRMNALTAVTVVLITLYQLWADFHFKLRKRFLRFVAILHRIQFQPLHDRSAIVWPPVVTSYRYF